MFPFLCSRGPMFLGSYITEVLCSRGSVSEVICSRGPMFSGSYVPEVLCSRGPIFPRSIVFVVLCSRCPMFPKSYIPEVLYSRCPMFPRSYVSEVLCRCRSSVCKNDPPAEAPVKLQFCPVAVQPTRDVGHIGHREPGASGRQDPGTIGPREHCPQKDEDLAHIEHRVFP